LVGPPHLDALLIGRLGLVVMSATIGAPNSSAGVGRISCGHCSACGVRQTWYLAEFYRIHGHDTLNPQRIFISGQRRGAFVVI